MPESVELHKDIQTIRHDIRTQNQLIKTLLSLEKSELLRQKSEVFFGKSGPRVKLIELYLAIGKDGKTRKELEDFDLRPGTIRPYCIELLNEALLQVTETRPDGQDVLGYTVIEEICRLSQHLSSRLADPSS